MISKLVKRRFVCEKESWDEFEKEWASVTGKGEAIIEKWEEWVHVASGNWRLKVKWWFGNKNEHVQEGIWRQRGLQDERKSGRNMLVHSCCDLINNGCTQYTADSTRMAPLKAPLDQQTLKDMKRQGERGARRCVWFSLLHWHSVGSFSDASTEMYSSWRSTKCTLKHWNAYPASNSSPINRSSHLLSWRKGRREERAETAKLDDDHATHEIHDAWPQKLGICVCPQKEKEHHEAEVDDKPTLWTEALTDSRL